MLPGAVAGRRVVDLARMRFRHRDQLFDRLRREILAHHDDERKFRQHADRREVGDRIVGQMREQARIDRHAGVEPGLQGVAVGRRPGGKLGTRHRAGAGPVVDHERLAELLGQLLADDAGHDVGAAAGGRGDDDGDRPGRKIVRRQRGGGQAEAQQRNGKHLNSVEHAGIHASNIFHFAPRLGGSIRGPLAGISDWNESPRDSVISSRGLRQRHRLQETVVGGARCISLCLSACRVPPDRPAETHESSAAKQRRMSTTATLLAVAVCAILAKGHLLEARTPSHNAAVAQNAGTAPVTIVAPEFCKDQTWPYIDSRCLRRVDNPPRRTRSSSDCSAGHDRSGNARSRWRQCEGRRGAAAMPKPPHQRARPQPRRHAPARGAELDDTRAQVIQSVFPAAESTATRDDNVQRSNANTATDAPAYQRTSDVSQHRRSRHWNNHSGFFGFRF